MDQLTFSNPGTIYKLRLDTLGEAGDIEYIYNMWMSKGLGTMIQLVMFNSKMRFREIPQVLALQTSLENYDNHPNSIPVGDFVNFNKDFVYRSRTTMS